MGPELRRLSRGVVEDCRRGNIRASFEDVSDPVTALFAHRISSISAATRQLYQKLDMRPTSSRTGSRWGVAPPNLQCCIEQAVSIKTM